jgi:hypothetical protein
VPSLSAAIIASEFVDRTAFSRIALRSITFS